MKLPAIPFLTKNNKSDYFLALLFEVDKIIAILFKEHEKSLVVLSQNWTSISQDPSTELLLSKCDAVISKTELSLAESAVLEKTIFVVPHAWIDDGKINSDKLSQLKKISTELALTPLGFIVSIEAIVAFLQKKEGAPINGIFVELGEKVLTVYIVRSSGIIDVKMGDVVDGYEKTVERLLGRVTKLDVLPSKIILLHTKKAEDEAQKFLSHHWTKDLPFMHLPQVAILDSGFEKQAIVNGVATQLNVEVREGIHVAAEEEVEMNSEENLDNDDFGFLKDEDIASKNSKDDEVTFTDHSFDFKDDETTKEHDEPEEDEPEDEGKINREVDEEKEIHKKRKKLNFDFGILLKPSAFFAVLSILKGGKKLIFIPILLVVLMGVIYAYYAFLLQAQVIVFTDQKAVSKDSLQISLTTDGETSFEDKKVKISTLEEEVSGSEEIETTGQKDTGQKATGSITIFNKAESSKKLEKGTIVTSSNKLDFTLDEEVNIASTSSFATSFSSSKAKIVASNFGKEYNLPSQTNFTVKGLPSSDVFGKNDTAFSGGTKEIIQVVSKKDLQELENLLSKKLFEQAKSKANEGISKDDGLIPSALSSDFVEKDFDKKVDEKASSIKLEASIDYVLGVYKRDELEKFITSTDEFDVPKDFKLSDSDSSINLTDVVKSGSSIKAKISFDAIFKPQLDIKSLPESMKGKSQSEAVESLKKISGISDATILYKFRLPFMPYRLPLRSENITIEQKSQS